MLQLPFYRNGVFCAVRASLVRYTHGAYRQQFRDCPAETPVA